MPQIRALVTHLLTALVAYALGIFMASTHIDPAMKLPKSSKGKVISLDNVPKQPVNHEIAEGASDKRPIMKQVMISNGEIPHLTGFSQAHLAAGQEVPAHAHKTMHEVSRLQVHTVLLIFMIACMQVFFVVDGTGTFEIGGQLTTVKRGTLIHLAPGERHRIIAGPASALQLQYFGIAVGRR